MGTEIEIYDEMKKKKQLAWGNFGLNLPDAENALAGTLITIEATLKADPTKENIVSSEQLLKASKEDSRSLKEARLEVTNPLDKVKARIMEHEKKAVDAIQVFEGKVIATKQLIAQEAAAGNARREEISSLKSKIKLSYIDYNADVDQHVKKIILDEYVKMLDEGVKFEDFDKYVSELTIEPLKHNVYFKRQGFFRQQLTEEEFKEMYIEEMEPAVDFIKLFASGMVEKKAGYRSELANKAKAKELLAAQAKKNESAREEKKAQENLAVKIDKAIAVDAVPAPLTKALKLVFEVDMPNNSDSALKLYACFSANMVAVTAGLNVKNWLDLKPSQIGKVLGKLKSKDNSLEFSGISFKSIDKL